MRPETIEEENELLRAALRLSACLKCGKTAPAGSASACDSPWHRGVSEAPRQKKLMPVDGGPCVPWDLIAPHEKQAQKNHGQSLDRLAERGGITPGEALAILGDIDYCSANRDELEKDGAQKLQYAIDRRLAMRAETKSGPESDLAAVMSLLQRHQPGGSPPPGGPVILAGWIIDELVKAAFEER